MDFTSNEIIRCAILAFWFTTLYSLATQNPDTPWDKKAILIALRGAVKSFFSRIGWIILIGTFAISMLLIPLDYSLEPFYFSIIPIILALYTRKKHPVTDQDC